jgi:hypothetical protein
MSRTAAGPSGNRPLPLDRLIAMTGGRLDTAGIGEFLGHASGETR